MGEFDRVIKEFVASVFEARVTFFVVVMVIMSFLVGAAVEHYQPALLLRLWY